MLKGLLMAKTTNLGDDIQAWPAWKFWSDIDIIIDRDTFNVWWSKRIGLRCSGQEAVVMNGWFTHNPSAWPPPSRMIPLFISFHLTPEAVEKVLRPEVVDYLANFEIGARDIFTMNVLKERGIRAYFSGCLTLTISEWLRAGHFEDTRSIMIVDVDPALTHFLPKEVRDRTFVTTQDISPKLLLTARNILGKSPIRNFFSANTKRSLDYASTKLACLGRQTTNPWKRLALAEDRLVQIAKSRLVITSRLHVALPAASMGVPVIFVHKNLDKDVRFQGLLDFINAYTPEEFADIAPRLDYERLENPNAQKLGQMKWNLLQKLSEFRQLLFSLSY